MYLLYADDSGSPSDRKQAYFVLGGVAVFERQVHWIGQELDKVAAPFDLISTRPMELHGSPMVNGREGWEAFPRPDRLQAVRDALGVLVKSMQSTAAFCVAVRKAAIPGIDPCRVGF